jgi:hypothetical protein
MRIWSIAFCMFLLGAPVRAEEATADDGAPAHAESICLMVESAAAANGLPLAFFARLIWQESRFRPDAVGPQTRNGDHALGIAQFMPRTAAERRLLDPFDPVEALPRAAEFLRELVDDFGNLGLAAAAYNAGPRRVRDWLAGRGGLPGETRAYVRAITGQSPEDWVAARRDGAPPESQQMPRVDCSELIVMIHQTPNDFVEQLEHRVAQNATAPWGVQLSAGFSRAGVLSRYAELEKHYRPVLAGHDPAILRMLNRSRGSNPFYQIRVGAESREAANKLCGSLRTAGAPCLVLRNPPSTRAM